MSGTVNTPSAPGTDTDSFVSRTPGAGLGNPIARMLRLGVARVGVEVRAYFRQTDAVFFTFLFPVLLLTIFSVAFSDQDFGRAADGTVLKAAQYYLPAMLASGVLLSGVQNLATDIAGEKSDGTLKRLAGTPLPVASYFLGKLGQVLVTAILQAILVVLVARFAFGAELPGDASLWGRFAWVFLLGVITSAVLGIALSALPRSGRSATAVVVPIVLVLQFISGVYLNFTALPSWLQDVASVFPLKWMAQGMRSVFLPDAFASSEPDGGWNLGGIALVLLIWLVAGLVLARVTFRWVRKNG